MQVQTCKNSKTYLTTFSFIITGFLFGRAIHRAIGAKYTTVAWFRFQKGFAVFTLVKIKAGIGRHYFFLFVATFRACDGGFKRHLERFVSNL